MSDPWRLELPPSIEGAPAPLPPRLARLTERAATNGADPYAAEFPRAAELPEVRALIERGWHPLDDAPLYCLLPAAWPTQHLAWVPDRLPRMAIGSAPSAFQDQLTAVDDEPDWAAEDRAEQARAADLPEPPTGRIWLLRSPWPRIPVTTIHEIIWSLVEDTGREDEIQCVYEIAREMLTWDEDRALESCPAESRELLEAWAEVGRHGEAAASMVERGMRPDVLVGAMTRTGLDERSLLAWLDSMRSEPDDRTVDFIVAWRAAELPGNPPPGAGRFLDRDPAELTSWLDAGFDLYSADRLRHAGLATAIRWRDNGFSPEDTYTLLRADPTLTPAEALAFDEDATTHARRADWIYYGFAASQAAGWAAAGLSPYQARIWRACGKGPQDVATGEHFPPELMQGRRYFAFSQVGDGERTNAEWDELPDPVGTRGRHARRRTRADDDPWINSD